jgi:hypothetical protein
MGRRVTSGEVEGVPRWTGAPAVRNVVAVAHPRTAGRPRGPPSRSSAVHVQLVTFALDGITEEDYLADCRTETGVFATMDELLATIWLPRTAHEHLRRAVPVARP